VLQVRGRRFKVCGFDANFFFSGPLLVRGRQSHVNSDPEAALNRNPGHLETRSKCQSESSKTLGLAPLVDESGHASQVLSP
jgi:hypothetical protein